MPAKFVQSVRNVAIGSIVTSLFAAAALAQVPVTSPQVAGPSVYEPSGYTESYQGSFYPARELRALPPARAAAAASTAQLHRAESNLTHTLSDARRASTRSQDMIDALSEERADWETLKTAREQALADLKNDPTYQATAELRDRLADQIEQSRAKPETTPQQLRALAEVKLSHATTLSAMEASAIGADPQVKAARERLVAAGNRVATLRQAADDAVRSNPDVIAARNAVEDARVAAIAADTYYTEARNVAGLAVGYAYDLMANPQPYSIYGGGYGYPYAVTGGYAAGAGYPVGYPYSWRATSRTRRRPG